MPETAQHVADEFGVSREDQDAFALRSQARAAAAQASGVFAAEIVAVETRDRKGAVAHVAKDEHPRETTREALAKLRGIVRPDGSVTAGNASGINDGAVALVVASGRAVEAACLAPVARVLGYATAGVAPRVMGVGPIPAVRRLCERLGLKPSDFDAIELNEAFASQGLAVLRGLGLPDDGAHVNPNGGAIALGHPLGMSGARLAGTLALELRRRGGRYGLATMCVGVGQGAALAIERVRGSRPEHPLLRGAGKVAAKRPDGVCGEQGGDARDAPRSLAQHNARRRSGPPIRRFAPPSPASWGKMPPSGFWAAMRSISAPRKPIRPSPIPFRFAAEPLGEKIDQHPNLRGEMPPGRIDRVEAVRLVLLRRRAGAAAARRAGCASGDEARRPRDAETRLGGQEAGVGVGESQAAP